MAEPCVIMGLFVTFGMLLPLFFPCTPTACVVSQGDSTPICPEGASSHVKYMPKHQCCAEVVSSFLHLLCGYSVSSLQCRAAVLPSSVE